MQGDAMSFHDQNHFSHADAMKRSPASTRHTSSEGGFDLGPLGFIRKGQ
jgi:hypothetical protein